MNGRWSPSEYVGDRRVNMNNHRSPSEYVGDRRVNMNSHRSPSEYEGDQRVNMNNHWSTSEYEGDRRVNMNNHRSPSEYKGDQRVNMNNHKSASEYESDRRVNMNNHWSPSEYKGDRRVKFNGIENGASIDQMYVARSQCRGSPSRIRRVKTKSSSSSSTSLVSSLKAWLHDPEIKRKKRIAKYKAYTIEGDRSKRGNGNMYSQQFIPIAPKVPFGTSTSSSITDATQTHHTSSSSFSPSRNPNLHGLHASCQTCKEPPNGGKTYFGCPMQKSEMCKLRIHEDDQSQDKGNKKTESSRRTTDNQNKNEIRELAEEMKTIQKIVEKLSHKKSCMIQEERKVKVEISEIRMKLFVEANNEKYISKTLLLTWFCIVSIGVGVLAMKVHGMINNNI